METPEFKDSTLPKVRLLQGALYREDGAAWAALENHVDHVRGFFTSIGLTLVYAPEEGYAYLEQMDVEEAGIPVLIRRARLSLEITALGLVLRDELSAHDGSFSAQGLPIIARERIVQRLEGLIPNFNDQRRRDALVERAIKSALDLKFLKATEQADAWEIRRVVKARFPLEVLDDLRARLQAYAAKVRDGKEEDANATDGA